MYCLIDIIYDIALRYNFYWILSRIFLEYVEEVVLFIFLKK